MSGFTKLHECIVRSSIWTEDLVTRIVFVTFLAMADASGNVIGVRKRLAASANVSIEEYDRAIEKLSSPDPESKTPDHEGRRIIPIPGGWHLVNYAKYRANRDPERRREQNREAKRRQREREKKASAKCQPKSAQAEAEAEAEADTAGAALTPALEFETHFWPNVPNRIGKGKAREAYIKARKKTSKDAILAGLPRYASYEKRRAAQPDYRPLHPATWLNQERWDDEDAGKPKSAIPPARKGVRAAKER
jgi:hypothetical protein